MIGIDVTNVNVVITGASGVLGDAIARGFLENGAYVANWDISDSDRAKRLREDFPENYFFVNADIQDEASISNAAIKTLTLLRGVDCLINNAGVIAKQEVKDIDAEVIDRMYNINVRGTILVTKHLVDFLKKSGRGRIVNISSVQAAIGMETYSPYTFTKAAVSGLTRVWALELAPYNITTNALCPGWADTEMVRSNMVERLSALHNLDTEETKKLILSYVPQKRFIDPREIAFASLYLCSSLGAAVNGAELFLDAGVAHCAKAGLSMLLQ
jgi:3-hydroxybutyrate dehydrogenase